jgi:hypothetical protein
MLPVPRRSCVLALTLAVGGAPAALAQPVTYQVVTDTFSIG